MLEPDKIRQRYLDPDIYRAEFENSFSHYDTVETLQNIFKFVANDEQWSQLTQEQKEKVAKWLNQLDEKISELKLRKQSVTLMENTLVTETIQGGVINVLLNLIVVVEELQPKADN